MKNDPRGGGSNADGSKTQNIAASATTMEGLLNQYLKQKICKNFILKKLLNVLLPSLQHGYTQEEFPN